MNKKQDGHECKNVDSFKEVLNIVARLERSIDNQNKRIERGDQERIAGQEERKKIDDKIFKHLQDITDRNSKLDGLYEDVQKGINLWKKYGKPLVWFVSFIGGAAIVVFKLWRLFIPKP